LFATTALRLTCDCAPIDHDEALTSLTAMGLSRDASERALRAFTGGKKANRVDAPLGFPWLDSA